MRGLKEFIKAKKLNEDKITIIHTKNGKVDYIEKGEMVGGRLIRDAGVDFKDFVGMDPEEAKNALVKFSRFDPKTIMIEGCKKVQESVLPTENPDWGFFGSVAAEFNHNSNENAKKAWPIAFVEVQKATGWSDTKVRDWLDSRNGRHFSDQCADFGVDTNMKDAISQAAKFWKERKWF